jgi:hypothetical protein
MSERIKLKDALPILGLSERTVRAMAACGDIPGAAFYAKRWTFDQTKLRQFVKSMEAATWQRNERPRRAVSGGAQRSGAVSRSRVETSSSLYAQTIQKLRSAAMQRNAGGR